MLSVLAVVVIGNYLYLIFSRFLVYIKKGAYVGLVILCLCTVRLNCWADLSVRIVLTLVPLLLAFGIGVFVLVRRRYS